MKLTVVLDKQTGDTRFVYNSLFDPRAIGEKVEHKRVGNVVPEEGGTWCLVVPTKAGLTVKGGFRTRKEALREEAKVVNGLLAKSRIKRNS